MKINWKVRFRSKPFVVTFLTAVVVFVFQILGLIGVVVPVSEDMAMQFISIFINLLLAMGILIDPTTKGISDSQRALEYKEPN